MDQLLTQLQNDVTPETAVLTIVSATELPGIFVFGEFLDNPAIQKLAGSPHSHYVDLLHLFCYGSFQSYMTDKEKFADLSMTQIRKLKQLSIIDEAHVRKFIPYEYLFKILDLNSSRELEDLVIDLFYLEALTGKLDQQQSLLVVDSAIGRDIRIEQIPELKSTLDGWLKKVEHVLVLIAKEIKLANDRRFEAEFHNKEVLEAAAAIKEAARNEFVKSEADTARMDIDDHLIHPDLLTDGRFGASCRVPLAGVDSPGGDKDGRSRMAVFKGLRKGNR